MADDYNSIEKLLRDADFTKGSSHKERLKEKLFSDELGFDELKNVQAAVKRDEGIFPPDKH